MFAIFNNSSVTAVKINHTGIHKRCTAFNINSRTFSRTGNRNRSAVIDFSPALGINTVSPTSDSTVCYISRSVFFICEILTININLATILNNGILLTVNTDCRTAFQVININLTGINHFCLSATAQTCCRMVADINDINIGF